MKNIILIEPYSHIPTDSGGKVRIYNTIKYLKSKFNVLVYNYTETTPNKRPFTPIPYWFSNWYSKEYIKKLKSTDFTKYNTVIIETSQLLYLIDYLPDNLNTIFVAHDISTVSFWRRLKEAIIYKWPIHFIRLIQVYLYEQKYLKKFKTVVAVSQNDAKILKEKFAIKYIVTIPNGIEKIDFLKKEKIDKPKIGYIGSTSHSPNINAIKFLSLHLATKYKTYIAGNNHLKFQNITNLGFVDSPKDFYQQIDILVAPIYSGSGSRIKIIESLSFGIPVITTSIGAEGIEIVSPYLIIIKDYNSPSTWLAEIKNIYKNINKQDKNNLKQQLNKYLWSNTLKPVLQLL